MTEDVWFSYGGNEFRGDTVIYNVNDERVVVNPGGPGNSGGRVQHHHQTWQRAGASRIADQTEARLQSPRKAEAQNESSAALKASPNAIDRGKSSRIFPSKSRAAKSSACWVPTAPARPPPST